MDRSKISKDLKENPYDVIIDLATKIKKYQAANEKLKKQLEDVKYTKEGTILVRDLAHILTDKGVKTNERALFNWLKKHGYLCFYSILPTRKAMDMGLFEMNTYIRDKNDLELPYEAHTVRITETGQEHLINRFLKEHEK